MQPTYSDIEEGALRQMLAARVVLVCGVSGSGKTTLARALERHGFTRLSADQLIWQRYGDAFACLPDEERSRIFQSIGNALADELLTLLDAGCRVAVDATLCRRAKRDQLRQSCRSRGVEPLVVHLSASKPQLLRRLAGRRGGGPDDQLVSPAQLDEYLANFEVPTPDESPLLLTEGRQPPA